MRKARGRCTHRGMHSQNKHGVGYVGRSAGLIINERLEARRARGFAPLRPWPRCDRVIADLFCVRVRVFDALVA